MSSIKALGIDLAKLVFSIHGVDEHSKCKLRKTVKRNNLLAEVAKLPPCIIGMEACSGAHYWAREFTKLGHDVRIMASKFVIPYRQSEKNDANDAEAICEAVTRPKTRFVSIKSEEQQAVLCLHRIRQGLIKDRTARINRLRGLLAEFGLIMPKGRYPAQNIIGGILEDAENGLPMLARELLHDTWQSIRGLNEEILKYDRKLYALANQMKAAKRLMSIPGIGEITATAVVATVNDAKHFESSQLFLVPLEWLVMCQCAILYQLTYMNTMEKHMDAISYTAARANLANTMAHVCNDHAPIIITRKSEDPVVMMSLEDYNAMQETTYLLRSPANARNLLESIAELEAGKGTERELLE